MTGRDAKRTLYRLTGKSAALRHRLQRRVDPEDWIFFIHIPKTAGTSFRIAADWRLRGRVLRDYGPHSAETSREIQAHVHERRDLEALARVVAEREIGMICGHVQYRKYKDLVDPERVVVFLREPCQRVVSEYHHHRRHHGFDGTLLDFARQPPQRNRQWRMVRGLNLRRAALVGLSDHYRESLRLLAVRTGLTLSGLQLNANPERRDAGPYELGERDAAELRELNAEDVLLYRRAVEDFAAATQSAIELPPGLPEATAGPASSGEKAPVTGRVGRFDGQRLFGWAIQAGTGRPASLDVLVGGELIRTVAADRYRRQLDERGVHPTGHAGFVAELGELAAGTVIRCRLHGTDQELPGSPVTV